MIDWRRLLNSSPIVTDFQYKQRTVYMTIYYVFTKKNFKGCIAEYWFSKSSFLNCWIKDKSFETLIKTPVDDVVNILECILNEDCQVAVLEKFSLKKMTVLYISM